MSEDKLLRQEMELKEQISEFKNTCDLNGIDVCDRLPDILHEATDGLITDIVLYLLLIRE